MLRRGAVAWLVLIAAGAVACDARTPNVDGSVEDAESIRDSSTHERDAADDSDAGSDSGVDGGSARDAGTDAALDTGVPDAGASDAGLSDSGLLDAGPRDAGARDVGPPDAGLSDAGLPDTGAPDAGPRDAGPPDSGPPDSGPAVDAGPPLCFQRDLVLSAIHPGTVGGSIAIYNAGDAVVDVDATAYRLHEDPDSVRLRDLEAGVVIPPGATHRFPYPLSFSDGHASGEMALYRSDAIDEPAAMVDFVCWGFGHSPAFSVRPIASAAGLYSGPCTPSIVAPELRRIAGSDGATRDSYDPTGQTPLYSCVP